jgi:hypothetical protein
MASREPQRPEIDANRRREPLKRINLSGQLALMGETRRFRPFFRKLLGDFSALIFIATMI